MENKQKYEKFRKTESFAKLFTSCTRVIKNHENLINIEIIHEHFALIFLKVKGKGLHTYDAQ